MVEIWSYLAVEANEAIATRLLDQMEAAMMTLTTFPEAHPSRDSLGKGLRVAHHGNYAIYYILQNAELVIVRVLHGARDAAAIAESGGFSDL